MPPDREWYDRARDGRQLTVFAGATLKKSLWAGLFPRVIADFNTFSNQQKLGVTLTQSPTAPAEAENDFSGADIRFEAGNTFQFKAAGQDITVAIDPLVQGKTRTLAWDFGKGAQIRKACILMRARPMADDFPRVIGDPCLIAFAIHECIHAIGLNDHTPGGGDLLEEIPQLRTGARDKPNDDTFEVKGGKRIPPLFLLSATLVRIQKLWPPP
jgi:hypothetical protein